MSLWHPIPPSIHRWRRIIRFSWHCLSSAMFLAMALRVRLSSSWQIVSTLDVQPHSTSFKRSIRNLRNGEHTCSPSERTQWSEPRRSHFHSSVVCQLNRFLFDPCELDNEASLGVPTVTLPKQDYRTIHAAKILGVHTGATVRAGVVGCNETDGLLTDETVVEWISEGAKNRHGPLKNGDPPGALRFRLEALKAPAEDQRKMSVSLILALPRPLQLGRLLPMISQLGVDHLVLTSARKVQADYFGSHLFRQPEELRERLIEGLCQAGDVCLPTVHVVRNPLGFLKNEIDDLFPLSEYARVIAHPQRTTDGQTASRGMRGIEFPSGKNPPRMVVAVGPEGGWVEPDELQHYREHGFQQVALGTRVLRSDVAVVSLLTLAHDVCSVKADEM